MSSEKEFSVFKGYAFFFEENGNLIKAWFSSLSGLEKIYVNGELVSTQRNLSMDSTHSFNIHGDEYSINLRAASLLKGPFRCTLNKNGDEYKRQKLVFSKSDSPSKKPTFLITLFTFCVLGFLFGFIRSYWQMPEESLFVFIALLSVAVFTYQFKNHKGSEALIEDEEIV